MRLCCSRCVADVTTLRRIKVASSMVSEHSQQAFTGAPAATNTPTAGPCGSYGTLFATRLGIVT